MRQAVCNEIEQHDIVPVEPNVGPGTAAEKIELSVGDVSRAERIYIVCGYTDMRKAIDGLADIVQQNFMLDVFSGSLFLFCGKRCDRIKALLWEEDGFVLLYKRLENGKYKWPRDSDEARQITQKEFRWLMEGLSIEQKTAIKPAKTVAVC